MQTIDLVPDLRPTILAARQLRDARNTLARFLPNRNVQAITYRMGRRKRVDQTVPIRAFDAPAVPIMRPGIAEIRGALPALTPIVDLSEVDLNNELVLAQQLAGMPVDWQPFVTAGAAECAITIDNSLELFRGQVLGFGQLAMTSADGSTHAIDWEVPADQKIVVGAPWDPANAAGVFADYQSAHEVHLDSSGSPAGIFLTTTAVYNVMLAALQGLFPQQPVGDVSLSAYLSSRKLPQVVTHDRKLRTESGKVSVYPPGRGTFLPAEDEPVGETQLGITQEAVQQVGRRQPNGSTALQAGEVAGVTIVTLGEDNPVNRSVKGAAVGLPVLRDNEDITILSGLI